MRKAVYASGSATANLDFAYEVQVPDFDTDGVSLCSDTRVNPGRGCIQLDGGTIVAASDSAEAALALPDQDDRSGHKVDGTPMTFTPMTFTPMPEIALTPAVPSIGEVPVDWSLYRSGLRRGKGFRLLFITTGTRRPHVRLPPAPESSRSRLARPQPSLACRDPGPAP